MLALLISAFLAVVIAFGYALLAVPFEATQGVVQKIFYFHVPSAFAMYFFCLLGVIFACLHLITKTVAYDLKARASFYTALVFGILVIGSGPLWAKPVWGVYWTWDPRLTLTFIVFILLLGYVFARKIFDDRGLEDRGALVGSILGILALPMMLLTHLSVKIWRGLHPSVLREERGLDDSFSLALQLGVLAIFILGFAIFAYWSRILELERAVMIVERKRR